ncbi:multidrug efflux SMR transporter [Arenibaculum sp.]|jgi:quaternary ammonium compound-resistance protein SugE|uniref:DMT family transporter n=1 Tax=Arenibaculum sp. TaxID=2865862 RepID=UPI002E129708|nr:multidrug efflux SMR transporter [Arenibaculum sp.]
MGWVLLVAAGLLEIVWATALKHADGFARPVPSAVGIATAAASFYLLALALKSLPVGTAYAAWVGIGTAGVAVAGIVAFGEPASPARLGCLALILAGVAGLKLVEG